MREVSGIADIVVIRTLGNLSDPIAMLVLLQGVDFMSRRCIQWMFEMGAALVALAGWRRITESRRRTGAGRAVGEDGMLHRVAFHAIIVALVLVALPAIAKAEAVLYVTAGDSSLPRGVLTYDLHGNLLGSFAYSGAAGLAVLSNGNLVVDSYGGGTVTEFSPSEKNSATLPPGLAGPDNLTIGPDGNLYISDFLGNEVYRYSFATSTLSPFLSIDRPQGLVFDSAGNFYVADHNNSRVVEYNASGSTILRTLTSGVSGPDGLAIDSSGNIYVANGGGDDFGTTIRKFWHGSDCEFRGQHGLGFESSRLSLRERTFFRGAKDDKET